MTSAAVARVCDPRLSPLIEWRYKKLSLYFATFNKEWPKQVRRLKSNAAPMIFPAGDAPEICKARDLGLEELDRRARVIQGDRELQLRLISASASLKGEYSKSPHVEKQIYDGFFETEDEKLMNAFHEREWPDRFAIVQKFRDPRLRTIGMKLIHQERPDLMSKTLCQEHGIADAKRLLGQGDDVSWLTLPQALQQIEQMLKSASSSDQKLLRELKDFLRSRHKRAVELVK